jgi:hypothetical protein
MPTVQLEAQLSPEQLLKAVGQLSTPELEAFADDVLTLRAERVAPRLPVDEAALLQQINQGLPDDLQARFDALVARRRAEVLIPQEHAELLALTEKIEQMDARRLEHLVDLSRLRKVPLKQLMEQMGLRPRPHD